jgi:hypothetical protein
MMQTLAKRELHSHHSAVNYQLAMSVQPNQMLRLTPVGALTPGLKKGFSLVFAVGRSQHFLQRTTTHHI